MVTGNSEEEVRIQLEKIAFNILEDKVNAIGYSDDELGALNQTALQVKLKTITALLKNKERLKKIGTVRFEKGVDFTFSPLADSPTVGYTFFPYRNLSEKKKFILELLNTKSREEKITSLEDLINNVSDKDLRIKIENELKELNTQTTKFEQQVKEADQEEREFESSKKQLEISKTKLDLLEKKSQIWLAILAKESIASIVGAILLVVISICLLVSMFIGVEPTKIIENTFLLILGYFFGHAVSKK